MVIVPTLFLYYRHKRKSCFYNIKNSLSISLKLPRKRQTDSCRSWLILISQGENQELFRLNEVKYFNYISYIYFQNRFFRYQQWPDAYSEVSICFASLLLGRVGWLCKHICAQKRPLASDFYYGKYGQFTGQTMNHEISKQQIWSFNQIIRENSYNANEARTHIDLGRIQSK